MQNVTWPYDVSPGGSAYATDTGALEAPAEQPAQQPDEAAAPAGEGQQAGAEGPSQDPTHATARRAAGPAAARPPLFISGNHIQRPQRLRKLSEDHQKIRRRVGAAPGSLLQLVLP